MTEYRTIHAIDSKFSIHFTEAMTDIQQGLLGYRSWLTRSIRLTRQKYRKTYLGPWWMTVSSLLTLASMSLLRSATNSSVSFTESLGYVGIGLILFSLLSNPMTLGLTVFFNESSYATFSTPLSSAVFREVANSFINFGHECVAILFLLIVFHNQINFSLFTVIFIIAAILIANFGMTLWLGCLSCRYRDIPPIALMIVRIQMFISPIFWSIGELPESSPLAQIADWNPFSYFIMLMRDSFLETSETSQIRFESVTVITAYALLNLIFGLSAFSYSRKRLVYWAEAT